MSNTKPPQELDLLQMLFQAWADKERSDEVHARWKLENFTDEQWAEKAEEDGFEDAAAAKADVQGVRDLCSGSYTAYVHCANTIMNIRCP